MKRLFLAALAMVSAVVLAAEMPPIEVSGSAMIPRGEKRAFDVDLAAWPEGKEAVLVLKARLDTPQVAGYNNALRITVNGTTLDASRLLNKPLRVKSRGGNVYSMVAGDLFSTFYCPDFESPDSDPHYGLLEGYKACLFELRITDLTKAGKNALLFEHVSTVENPLVLGDCAVAFREPAAASRAKAGPPEGPLSVYEPDAKNETEFTVGEPADGKIEVKTDAMGVVVESAFSTPAGEWVHGSNTHFRLERRIERKAESVVVHDTLTNLTAENLPVMHRHEAVLGDRLKKIWLGGLEQVSPSASISESSNPTTYAAADAGGVGLISLDDVFRVHVRKYCAPGIAGIGDNNLVLRPGASYTAEWAIIPTRRGDYWEFLNAARRLADANFTIPGCFAFLRTEPITDKWTDEQFSNSIRFKDAYYVCASVEYPEYKGHYTHGVYCQQLPVDRIAQMLERWKRLVPGTRTMIYFHNFIDILDESPERFADARVLLADGKQADYGEPWDRIFFPTEMNSYGPEIAKNVDQILDQIKADGVYWDEHEYSRWNYHYGEPWDGISGDIDSATMKLMRLKSSVTLLSAPWRLALAKKILARGPIVGNGVPFTRELAGLTFPCFVETGSITNCTQAHLYSPIALGDHLTERSEKDAYGTMLAALDYGCVYHWYNDVTVIPTHVAFTHYMYPFTPVELHAGYVVGRERILTKVSGLFGWGDHSAHETHVFNDSGCEVANYPAPLVEKDGKTYTELRLAEDWAAAIIKR